MQYASAGLLPSHLTRSIRLPQNTKVSDVPKRRSSLDDKNKAQLHESTKTEPAEVIG